MAKIGQFHLIYLLCELSIMLYGIGILIADRVYYGGQVDERTLAEKHAFYLRGGKGFIIAALAGYAWSIPANIDKTFNDLPANWLLLMLELLGGIYLFYQFKTRNINFNYTFIDHDSGYWPRVFGNIGKLALILLPVYALPAIYMATGHRPLGHILSVLWAWLASVIGLGLQYLHISWAERAAWRDAAEEDRPRISRAWLIMGIAALAIWIISQLWHLAAVAWSSWMDRGLLEILEHGGGLWEGLQHQVSFGEVLAALQTNSTLVGYMATTYLGMMICYLIPYIKDRAPAARRCIRSLLILSAVELLWSMLAKNTVSLLLGSFIEDAENAFLIFNFLFESVAAVFAIISLILWWKLLRCLCRQVGISKYLMAIPLLKIVSTIITLLPYIGIHNLYFEGAAIQTLISLAAELLLLILIWRHKTSVNPKELR